MANVQPDQIRRHPDDGRIALHFDGLDLDSLGHSWYVVTGEDGEVANLVGELLGDADVADWSAVDFDHIRAEEDQT